MARILAISSEMSRCGIWNSGRLGVVTLEFVILRWAFANLEISGCTERALPLLNRVFLRMIDVLLSV